MRVLSRALTLLLFVSATLASAAAEGLPVVYYGDVSLNSTYVTPRGLVVEDEGLTLKTLIGGSFDFYQGKETVQRLALNLGAYTNFLSQPTSLPDANGNRTDDNTIFDFDPFIGVDAAAFEKWKFNASYIAFMHPSGFYDAVHNVLFLAAYDDSGDLGPYALQPYVRTFTTLSGDSPALLGKTPASYAELGVAPRIPLPGSLGLSLFMPTAVFLAEPDFYGGSGTFATVSSGLLLTKQFGSVTVRAGVEYFFLKNENLRQASALLGNETEPSRWIGTVGLSFVLPG